MTTRPGEQHVIRGHAYAVIKKAFEANSIKFAFPTVQFAGAVASHGLVKPPPTAWWETLSRRLPIREKGQMNRRSRIFRIANTGMAALLIAGASSDASAQELEPHAYSPSPLGVNFLGLSYLRYTGGVAVDPSLPLDNIEAEVNTASLSYARTFGLFGRSASLGFVLPYSRADVSGDLFERQRAVTRSGLADLRLRLAVNLFGGPALDREEFAAREPTTLGARLMVVAPLGKYDPDRLINIGANRWTFKPEIGCITPLFPGTLWRHMVLHE
jgi:hypothetical protein